METSAMLTAIIIILVAFLTFILLREFFAWYTKTKKILKEIKKVDSEK